jgi:8-oxo-dGTP pyrophosphatase MutT (NUDIX family)
MGWSLTVAAVIQQDGRFLMVEERDGDGPIVLNQPAGHVEPGEGPLAAVIREVREETGLSFEPEALLGLYPLRAANGKDFLRICFLGRVPANAIPAPEDPDILGCGWFHHTEIAARPQRSGLVLRCLEDALGGRSLPLGAVNEVCSER